MTADSVAAHPGCVHEAGLYSSDEDFLDLLVPFVEDGLASGEPVITGYDDRKADLLRAAVGADAPVTYIGDPALYATPSRAIQGYTSLFEQHQAAGATRVRIAGDVPHPGNGGSFEGWDRYESAANIVWNAFPALALCLYDTRTAPSDVLEVVHRTHPTLVSTSGERRSNPEYVPTDLFRPEPMVLDVVEHTDAPIVLVDPSPQQARDALSNVIDTTFDERTAQGLLVGISEAVTNAHRYGRSPRTVRIWPEPTRIVLTVTDTGGGPPDPIAGLRKAMPSELGAGLGLWLTHQLCEDVSLGQTPDGFTVRIRAPRP